MTYMRIQMNKFDGFNGSLLRDASGSIILRSQNNFRLNDLFLLVLSYNMKSDTFCLL